MAFSADALLDQLPAYCNWQALPREVMVSAIEEWEQQQQQQGGPSASGTGGAPQAAAPPGDSVPLLDAFLRALAAAVPLEWTVERHAAGPGAARRPVTTHARAAGAPGGVLCFGGMEQGQLTEVRLQSDVSWVREHQGHMLVPDLSRVYQSAPSQPSRLVLSVAPRRRGGGWEAAPASPQLPAGLVGLSAVLCGSRVLIFGGAEPAGAAAAAAGDQAAGRGAAAAAAASLRPCSKLRAYAVDGAGTQGGLLPVLSDLPQLGQAPCARMQHSAAADPGGGSMWVYGGVRVRERDGARVPADEAAGVLHRYDLHAYSWETVGTGGSSRPSSTTLLAFWWHEGALWAIPDLPRGGGSGGSGRRPRSHAPPAYRLLRLDLQTKAWEEVPTQGEPPCPRSDACSVFAQGRLLVYGGRAAGGSAPPSSGLLSDLHSLDLQQRPPAWRKLSPLLVGAGAGALPQRAGAAAPAPARPAMLPLAGHAGAASGGGEVVFAGGYRRADTREPQAALQVLSLGVRPPTPETALLTGAAAAPLALALQHVRLKIARLVRRHHPNQVLLRPDGGGGVRLPARLLALHSCLFDDLFQGMLEGGDGGEAGGDGRQGTDQRPAQEVPVPGASLNGVAAVCRWVMGLLALGSCSLELLIDVYRVADRLVMERLMVDVLDTLGGMRLQPQQADVLLQLAGDLQPTGGQPDAAAEAARASAARRLRQHVTAATAPGLMELARQLGDRPLQECCVEAMRSHRKNDVWAVLDFACRFELPPLQGGCLAHLGRTSRGRLVDHADRVVKVAWRRAPPGGRGVPPVVGLLEECLSSELQQLEGVAALPDYAAAAERLRLQRLRQLVVGACATPETLRALQGDPEMLLRLQRCTPDIWAAAARQSAPT